MNTDPYTFFGNRPLNVAKGYFPVPAAHPGHFRPGSAWGPVCRSWPPPSGRHGERPWRQSWWPGDRAATITGLRADALQLDGDYVVRRTRSNCMGAGRPGASETFGREGSHDPCAAKFEGYTAYHA